MAAGGRTWGRATSAAGAWRAGTSPWRGSAGPAARGTTRATVAGGSQCPSISARRTCARRCDARGAPPSPSLPRARRAPRASPRARATRPRTRDRARPGPRSRRPRQPDPWAKSGANNIPSDSPRIRTRIPSWHARRRRTIRPTDRRDHPARPMFYHLHRQQKKNSRCPRPPVASLPPSAPSSAAASAAAPRATPR